MIRILIVEDEKPIADLLDMSLTSAGYSCDCLDNGAAAADAVESRRYDLILLDVMLPGIDGFELMEYLAPLEIPVIFITARSTVKDRIKGLKLGADDYIVKPFEIAELLARVETVLRRYHKTDTRTVDLHVQRLRKKLGWQERIAAVYKVGYRLEVKE